MKIALISDLHSSLTQLDAVLADIDCSHADRTLCLGDIVDMGPRPRAVIARLRERAIPCLLGNHDVTTGPVLEPIAVDTWCRAQLGDDERAFLAALPRTIDVELPGARKLLCVHGSPKSFDDEMLATTPNATLEAWLAGVDASFVAAGHTHVQMVRVHDGRTLINPGSVALPFGTAYEDRSKGPPKVQRWAEYALLSATSESGVAIELRRVAYDFAEFRRECEASGMPSPERWLSAFL